MTSEFNASAIVGEKIEQDTRELSQLLITSGNHDMKVVSILGTGGMGKTTLAQKIFNETDVQEHLKVKIWLSITQHFDEAELLKTAIEHAGGVHGGTQDKTLLIRTLTNTLSAGRFLLVLDDMWTELAWSHLLSVPIRNASQKQPGNWVIITTRFGDLAQRMGASFYQHHVRPMNEDDAWSLLNKQLPPSPNQVVGRDHLKGVGMKIIRKCGGLPLAIKVMGGLLSTRSQSEREWESVLNHHAWSVAGLPRELDNPIYLSYEDLSPKLRQCFLYCSLFPNGIEFRQANVVAMWIAEGFVQAEDGSSCHDDRLEEIADEYYEELITRNLIEPTHTDARYVCTMHDVVRSFAEFMAREDSLVVQDSTQVAGGIVRRMSVGPSEPVPQWAALQRQESPRTLTINCKINFEPGDSLACFSRLRVLSIYGGNCDRLVLGSLCQLRHLRYFGVEDTNISRLPEDIHRMKFLQHIIITNSRNLENLPRNIIKLVHLRTLSLRGSNANVTIPKGLGGLTNLRALSWFPVHMDDMDGGWCSLQETGPLSQLRHLSLCGLENVSASSLAEKARISSKEKLRYFELNWNTSGYMELRDEIEKQQQQHAVEEIMEKLCPPSHIQHLEIQGYFGRTLPKWLTVQATWAFRSLMLLRLQDLPCCTRLPDGLCQLPSLKSLNITDAPSLKSVGPEFQASSSSSSSTGDEGVTATTSAAAAAAFPNLINFHVDGLCQWEEWDWEDETAGAMAMPALEILAIRNCKLRCLPPGLANSKRHAHREVYLNEMANLTYVNNLPCVVELEVVDCPELNCISGLSMLHKIKISGCLKLEALENVPALDSLVLQDANMEELPGYLQTVNPRYLELGCSKKLCESATSPGSSEWNKISHIRKRNISHYLLR